MSLLDAIIMGLVQGLTEFLPVSSSGHLVIMHNILGFSDPPIAFDVLLHLGTLAAVLIAFRHDIMLIIRRPWQKLVGLLLVSSIPTAILGYFFKPYFESFFSSLTVVAVALIITGILLWFSDRLSFNYKSVREMSYWDAILIGIVQGLAITPGISRSGATIATGLFAGLDRELAARYSFLLSIPAILGACILKFKDILSGDSSLILSSSLLGAAVAAATGFFAILFLLQLVKKGRLSLFSYYCWAVGLIVLTRQFLL